MPIWENSRMNTLYYSEKVAWENHPCTIRIDNGEIIVEYEDNGLVIYTGQEIAPGHYSLNSPDEDGKGEATLHMAPGHLVLEGSWVVKSPGQNRKGMWKIFLA